MNEAESIISSTVLLIDMMHQRPFIWDFRRLDYKDSVKTKNAWNELAAHFGCTKDEMRRRWKKLRDSFFRAQKLYLERAAVDGYMSKPKWRYFDALSFLAIPGNSPQITNREDSFPTVPESSVDFQVFKVENDTISTPDHSMNMLGSGGGALSMATSTTSSMVEPLLLEPSFQSGQLPQVPAAVQSSHTSILGHANRSLKRRKLSMRASTTGCIKSDVPTQSSVVEEAFGEEEDAFGRMVAATLKKMSRRNKSTTKFKISQVLYEQEQTEITDSDASWWNTADDNNGVINSFQG